jgi:hypothetical protein
MEVYMSNKAKCCSVNITKEQEEKLNMIMEINGKSKSKTLSETIDIGLKRIQLDLKSKILYLVKVRIDTDLIMELGQRLQSGDLDISRMAFTYCLKDDPSVGISLWMAESKEHFEKIFAPCRLYYKEVMDIQEVIFPQDAMNLILANLRF